MADIDITLYYNQYRLEAMERYLSGQGKRLEDELYPLMDALYEKLVPDVERGEIETRIAMENARDRAEAEAARRFGVVRLHQGELDFQLITPKQKSLYDIATLYRNRLRHDVGKVSLWDIMNRFDKSDRILQSDFFRMCQQMPGDQQIAVIADIDFDTGTISACDNRENIWKLYRLQDIAVAAHKVHQASILNEKARMDIFLEVLDGRAIDIQQHSIAGYYPMEKSNSLTSLEFEERLNAIRSGSELTASAWAEWAKECERMDSGNYETEEGSYKTQGMFLKEFADRFDMVLHKYGVEVARQVISVADIPACLYPWEIMRAGEFLAGGGDIAKIPDMECEGSLEDFSDYPEVVEDTSAPVMGM